MSLLGCVLLAAEILVSAPAENSAETNAVEKVRAPRKVNVTSERSEVFRDQQAGMVVISFNGNVVVDDVEFKMRADEVTLFIREESKEEKAEKRKAKSGDKGKEETGFAGISGLGGSDALQRLVAIGHVSVTNADRSGSCAKATYNHKLKKVVMYGDEEQSAHFQQDGKHKLAVDGRKITFWTDTQTVQVDGSIVNFDAGDLGGKDGAKGLLGL